MREIPLTQGQVALVDDDDYDMLMAWKWHAQRDQHTYYARRHAGGNRKLAMHAQITGWNRVDHIDHDGLNNQRSNLRPATSQQNARNQSPKGTTSSYKGVYWYKRYSKWKASIRLDVTGTPKHLGYFVDEIAAARAYDAAARATFGEFAVLNFPLDSPS